MKFDDAFFKGNELLKEYCERFNEIPPKYITTSYDDPVYQKLLKNALDTNKPITKRTIGCAYRNIKIDRQINRN